MLAIAQLAHAKHVPFTYFSRALDVHKVDTTSLPAQDGRPALIRGGNLQEAVDLGMRHVTLSTDNYHKLVTTRDFTRALQFDSDESRQEKRMPLFIPQGGAFPKARLGVAMLADEINDYARTELQDQQLAVVLPCGTGTTAFYLAQNVLPSVEVFAVPCVGDSAYLRQQFDQLAREDSSQNSSSGLFRLPTILEPARKSRFGRLWWPLYEMHHEVLSETGIEFDLVYAAFAWHTLFNDGAVDRVVKPMAGRTTRELMFIHTGGVSGNRTMLERYELKKQRASHHHG
jgi:1-aminocyclopropane-1-carboxylate deaminase/D-cysteine desulfhydrase-like pyridoxal-dependent ACC family enzyme